VRPEWLVIKVMPVPPPQVRPTVLQDGALSQDDLTHVLVNIVKVNRQLESQVARGEPPHVVDQTERLLQMRVANFFSNGASGMQEQQRSGKLLKTIAQRIKGKEGRIRGNLMGKRVDFSARTVITADPNLSLDQVGVPLSIARNLTVPELVTPYNLAELHALVARGADEWPGAKSLIKGDDRFDLRYRHTHGHSSFFFPRQLRCLVGVRSLRGQKTNTHTHTHMAYNTRASLDECV
jgi:DNA-directed RNA polymerase II subunit RPB1